MSSKTPITRRTKAARIERLATRILDEAMNIEAADPRTGKDWDSEVMQRAVQVRDYAAELVRIVLAPEAEPGSQDVFIAGRMTEGALNAACGHSTTRGHKTRAAAEKCARESRFTHTMRIERADPDSFSFSIHDVLEVEKT